jgi:hypothetical protein
MEYLIGLILSLVVAGLAIPVGFDRDRPDRAHRNRLILCVVCCGGHF